MSFARTKFFRTAMLLSSLMLGIGTNELVAQTQASTGQINGTVRDASGAYIPNATVVITNHATSLKSTETSNAEGSFQFVLVPVGNYDVNVTAQGFTEAVAKDVTVEVGRTATLNVNLKVGGVEQSVEVNAEAIQVEQSQSDAYVNAQAINDLPIFGRRFQDFVTLTPTAQVEPSRNQISLAGQRGINGNIMIDGADYNQPFFGGIRGGERSNNAFTIPQESIREFQVTDAGYSAEFGRSTGGVVTAITKSGTNDLHGSLFYLNRNRGLAAGNDFFDEVASRAGRRFSPAPTQQQFGASLGGPLKKDKLFMFGAWEQQLVRQNRQVVFTGLSSITPTTRQTEAVNYLNSLQVPFKATNDANVFLGRTDWQINNTHRANFRYSHSENGADNANARGVAIFPTTDSAVSNNGREEDQTDTGVAELDSFFGANIANEFRFQGSREDRPRLANAQQPTVETTFGNVGTVSFLPTTQADRRYQIQDNVTWSHNKHSIKFGGDFNLLHAEQFFGFSQFGRFQISGTPSAQLDQLTCQLVNPAGTNCAQGATNSNRFDSTSTTYLRQVGNGLAGMDAHFAALFAQDSWKMLPNLTLNYGLRWEGVWNPQPQANNTNLINLVKGVRFPNGRSTDPTKIPNQPSQFGPRLGFAWDPFKNGKTVVRGFAGIYYAQSPLLLYAGPINNYRNPAGDLSISLPLNVSNLPGNTSLPCSATNLRACNTVYKQLQLIGVDLNTVPLSQLPILTVQQVQSIAALMGFDPTTAGVQPLSIDNNFKNPRSYQYGFGVEREIASQFTVGADVDLIKGVYLQRNRDLNLPIPQLRSATAPVTSTNCTTGDPAQRPFYGLRSTNCVINGALLQRPVSTLGQVQVRESTAKSLYRSLTLKAVMKRKWGQLNAFYTLSENLSDDDNERDAGGFPLQDTFNLAPEYSFSNLDRKHQFTMYPVFFLPYGFEVSTAVRLRSGRPIDASAGTDANEDRGGSDRPYLAPGLTMKRNAFRNLPTYNWDLRIMKHFKVYERVTASLSAEIFNLTNRENIQLSGSAVTNYCSGLTNLTTCGLQGSPTNLNFLSLIDRVPTSSTFGHILTSNNPGDPLQLQLGLRFQF